MTGRIAGVASTLLLTAVLAASAQDPGPDVVVVTPDGEQLDLRDDVIRSPDGAVFVVTAQQRDRGPEGTAMLGGRVVGASTGAPLRQAEVSLEAAGRRVRRTTVTDADGRYTFDRLPDGEYAVRVQKPGYLRLSYGQRYAFGRGAPVVVAAGERLEGVNFALPRGAVITVRVTDDRAEPVAGAAVRVQQFEYRPDGQQQLTAPSSGAVASGATDDRGEFRAYGLMPGEYVISATPGGLPGARAPALASGDDDNDPVPGSRLARTFYPGTISLERATPLSVGVGEETAVQFSLVAGRMGRIAGTVVDSRGQPAAGAQIQVVSRQETTVLPNRAAGRVASDGTFSIGDLPPGEHWLTIRTSGRSGNASIDLAARAALQQARELEAARALAADARELVTSTVQATVGDLSLDREFASVPVAVSGDDVTGLYIVTRPGIDVTGTVVVPTGASLPRRLRVRAQASDLPGSSVMSRPLDAAEFELSNVAGRVLFDAVLPSGWAVASVALNGRDITEEPLDLTGRDTLSGVVVRLTNAPTRVSGRVVDAGQPLRDYVVVLQPVEARGDPAVTARRVRAVRPDAQGRFEATGLHPGRYLATAVLALQEGREYSPEFRERLRPLARELVLREGDAVTLDLPLARGL